MLGSKWNKTNQPTNKQKTKKLNDLNVGEEEKGKSFANNVNKNAFHSTTVSDMMQ